MILLYNKWLKVNNKKSGSFLTLNIIYLKVAEKKM